MSNLRVWDHAFVLLVFLIFPLYSRFTIRGELNEIRQRGEPARIKAYCQVILITAAFALCVLAMWLQFDREWSGLGIRETAILPLVIGLAIAGIVIAAIVIPLRNLSQSPQRVAEYDYSNEMGDVIVLMPESRTEEAWFRAVSVNAGFSEELIYRGYLIWYLGHLMGPWSAATSAVLVFGLAHLYQGLKQLPGILLVSAIAVGLYVYTESLVVPIVFHILLDAIQGHYIARIKRIRAAVK